MIFDKESRFGTIVDVLYVIVLCVSLSVRACFSLKFHFFSIKKKYFSECLFIDHMSIKITHNPLFNNKSPLGLFPMIKIGSFQSIGSFFLSMICVLSSINVLALEQTEDYSETKIKAAYVYNFLNFIEWPNEAPSILNICVYGSNKKYVSAFNAMPAKTKTGAYLKVQYLDGNNKLLTLDTCQVIFITAEATTNTKKILKHVKNNHSLTFSESDKFIEQGGMINFLRRGSKVRFEINVGACKQAELTVSSKILRIAERLINEGDHE